MTFDSSSEIGSGQGFFTPNLVAIGHCCANWPLLDPSWPLHDLWPQQCIMLWSAVLPTKFGGHRHIPWLLTRSIYFSIHCKGRPRFASIALSGRPIIFLLYFFSLAFIMFFLLIWWWINELELELELSNLTPGWPQMTPAWPLTPAMHYTLVRGSHQVW